MVNYKLFIGSNNRSGKLEINKISNIITKYFDGFTQQLVTGSWKGVKEKTLIVMITTNSSSKITKLIEDLKTELEQEAIGLQTEKPIKFI